MARTFSKADRPIHRLTGLDYGSMEKFMADVQAARKRLKRNKALRSIARECRLWFKAHKQVEARQQIYSHQISQQDGLVSDKLVVATV